MLKFGQRIIYIYHNTELHVLYEVLISRFQEGQKGRSPSSDMPNLITETDQII